MRYSRCSVVLSLVRPVFLLGLPGGTHSHIDPGTGSIVIQAVIGAFAAVLVGGGRVLETDQSLSWQGVSQVKAP